MGFLDVSLNTANNFYNWGWRASVAGAVITCFGVGFLFWGTRVRDHDFEDSIAKLHDRASSSEEHSAALEHETARITSENLALATNLEREKAARARIEAGLASRHVSDEQKSALAAALKGIKLNIIISTYSNSEASAYEREVAAALVAAGQTVTEGSIVLSSVGSFSGLLVEESAASNLINALIASKLLTQKLSSQKNEVFRTGEGLNAILVGLKPNAF